MQDHDIHVVIHRWDSSDANKASIAKARVKLLAANRWDGLPAFDLGLREASRNLDVARALPLVVLLAVAASAPARSHHSAAVYYLLDRQVAIAGTVTRYTLGNPHSRIELRVKSADGTYKEWVAEGGSRTALMRKGWTGEELELGDVVAIVGNPARDGSNTIHWQTVILPNGRRLGESQNGEELERGRSSLAE